MTGIDPGKEQPAEPEESATRRPKPKYGELAPEGWQWQPPQESAAAAGVPSQHEEAGGALPKPGVPHNLGIAPVRSEVHPPAVSSVNSAPTTHAGKEPGKEQQPGVSSSDTFVAPPQQATSPSRNTQTATASAPQQAENGSATASPAENERLKVRSKRDSVATIILLVLGALGAIYSASSLMQTPAALSLIASALKLDNFTVPEQVATLGAFGALTMIAIQAVSLLLSIWRLTRKKLAFWVPLVAFGVAVIALIAFSVAMWATVPELIAHLQDPAASQQVIDYLYSSME